jgi:ComEC/Rec2-related protein
MLFSSLNTFSFLKTEFFFIHEACLLSNPTNHEFKPLWSALICAENLQSENLFKSQLQNLGLIHLFVVSGSHFLVLQWLLEKIKCPSWTQNILLWFYNAITGFSAPGTRACLGLTTKKMFQAPPEQKQLAISFLCLSLEPSWISSASFWLSWLASLILFVTPESLFQIPRQIIFYSTWILLGFELDLLSIPANLLIGPLISWILFPAAVMAYFGPAKIIFEEVAPLIQAILAKLCSESWPTRFPSFLAKGIGLTLLCHLILHLRRLSQKGKRIR